MTEYLPQLFLAWSIQLVGVFAPGPSVLLILGQATSRGRAAAVITATGIACASIILATATVLGIAALFAQIAELVILVRLIGAAYLTFLAYKAFRTAVVLPPMDLESRITGSPLRTALTGFLIQLSNPKAILFWLAVAAAGGFGNAPLPIVLIFIAGAFLNSWFGHVGYALLLSSDPFRRGYLAGRRWVEGALGCFFAGFALRLATERG